MKVAIIGINGRVGSELAKLASEDLTSQEEADVLIDFSHPSKTEELLAFAVRNKKPLVMGTTGHDSLDPIRDAGEKIPLLYASNFSLGILMMRQMASFLSNFLGERATYDLIEEHHESKIDAPSGTALSIQEALMEKTPIHSIRTRGSYGEHMLRIGMEGEQLIITHRALGRSLYAKIALEAARILIDKTPKLYSLEELFYADILRPVRH